MKRTTITLCALLVATAITACDRDTDLSQDREPPLVTVAETTTATTTTAPSTTTVTTADSAAGASEEPAAGKPQVAEAIDVDVDLSELDGLLDELDALLGDMEAGLQVGEGDIGS